MLIREQGVRRDERTARGGVGGKGACRGVWGETGPSSDRVRVQQRSRGALAHRSREQAEAEGAGAAGAGTDAGGRGGRWWIGRRASGGRERGEKRRTVEKRRSKSRASVCARRLDGEALCSGKRDGRCRTAFSPLPLPGLHPVRRSSVHLIPFIVFRSPVRRMTATPYITPSPPAAPSSRPPLPIYHPPQQLARISSPTAPAA